MIEAAKTYASTGEIWAIVVVAVISLAIWLVGIAWTAEHPTWRHHQLPDMQGPVVGGMHVAEGGRSVAPNRVAPPVLTIVDETTPDQAGTEPEREMAGAPYPGPGPAAGRPRVPGQQRQEGVAQPPAGQRAGAQSMPAQRTGDADQPEHATTGAGGMAHRAAELRARARDWVRRPGRRG